MVGEELCDPLIARLLSGLHASMDLGRLARSLAPSLSHSLAPSRFLSPAFASLLLSSFSFTLLKLTFFFGICYVRWMVLDYL